MDYQETIIKTVEKVLPTVVSITVAKDPAVLENQLYSELFQHGIPLNPEEVESHMEKIPRDEKGRIPIGGGSGFIISSLGIILTNKHVVLDPTASYTIVTHDEKKHDTEVIARDPINDIAILRIKQRANLNLASIKLGSSQDLKLGQTVIAIGNALGKFQNTISTGIVSGLSRLINATTDASGHQERLRGLIQTDAAINPGNSGGPLVDIGGKAIGINSAIVFGAQNIGFAIPIDKVRKDLEEIKDHGRIRRPFLGVRYLLLNKNLQKKFNLPANYGALVVNEGIPGDLSVIPNSASDKAGIQEHDIILACNRKKVTEKETLEDILSSCSVGEKIELEILRKNKKFTTSTTLGEMRG